MILSRFFFFPSFLLLRKSPRSESSSARAKLSDSKAKESDAKVKETESTQSLPAQLTIPTPTTPHKLSASSSATDLTSPRSKPMPPIPVRSNTLDQMELVELSKKKTKDTT
jgi:hypothetical protein